MLFQLLFPAVGGGTYSAWTILAIVAGILGAVVLARHRRQA